MEIRFFLPAVLPVFLAACGDNPSPSETDLQTPPTVQSRAAETGAPEGRPPTAPPGAEGATESFSTGPADQQTVTPATVGGSGEAAESTENRLKREAGEWVKETRELGSVAWDATKEKSGEYYEAAKEKSAEYYETIKGTSTKYYEAALEKSAEYFEPGNQEDEKLKEADEVDVERREGHSLEPESR